MRIVFRKHYKWIMTCILTISALIHIIYIIQLKNTPYVIHPLVDAEIYHQKALNILEFGWLGTKIFFQAPLYPYLLAIFYNIFGIKIEIIFWLQATISVINIYLIFRLGRYLFDIETGIFSALLSLFYGVFVFYSVFLIKVTFSIFFTCLFLLFFLWAGDSPSFKNFFKTGIFLGICILLRGNFLLVFAALALWMLLTSNNTKHRISYLFGFTLGVSLIIFPITLRNYYLERDFVLINYDAGPSFFIGNNAKANGMYQTFDITRPHPRYERKDFTSKAESLIGHPLKPSEVSAFWFNMSYRYILEKPLDWIALQWKKLFIFINNYEKSDNYNYELIKNTTPILNYGFISFGIILILSITAITLGRWRNYPFCLFYIFIIVYSVSVIMFYINSRYRLPLVPALIPFAAWLCVHGPSKIRASSKSTKICTLLVVFFCTIVTFKPIIKNDLIDAYLNYGGILELSGKLKEAYLQYENALSINPDYAKAHFNIASLLTKQGKIEKAIEHYYKTLQLKPEYAQAKNNLATIYIKRRQMKEAKKELLDSIKIQPDYADAHFNLGIIYNWQGNDIMAKKEFDLARTLDQAKNFP